MHFQAGASTHKQGQISSSNPALLQENHPTHSLLCKATVTLLSDSVPRAAPLHCSRQSRSHCCTCRDGDRSLGEPPKPADSAAAPLQSHLEDTNVLYLHFHPAPHLLLPDKPTGARPASLLLDRLAITDLFPSGIQILQIKYRECQEGPCAKTTLTSLT